MFYSFYCCCVAQRRPDWARLVASGQTEAVAAYKEHLRKLAAQQPLLLLAHAYTQYMAMAAGGQIIRRAARRQMGLPEDRGTAAFEFAVRHVHACSICCAARATHARDGGRHAHAHA